MKATDKTAGGNLRLGLSLPVFIGSLIAIFVGIFPGILGVWLWGAFGLAVPEFIKVGHAHSAWWAVLILIAALLITDTPFRPKLKKFIIFTFIAAVPIWMISMAAYFISKEARGIGPALPAQPGADFSLEYAVYGTGLFVIEVWFFAVLALVLLAAAGVRHRWFTQETSEPSRLELLTDIEFPRRVLWIPLVLGGFGLVVGWVLAIVFKARGLPVEPAALVQVHSHVFFFIVGYLMTLLAMRAIGTSDRVFSFTYRLGLVTLPLLAVSWVMFVAFGLPSLVHVVPSALYFVILILGLLALLGRFGLRSDEDEPDRFVRGATAFIWIIMILLVAVGPVISLVWSTDANVTVTFMQPEEPHVGPYPEEYIGTGPVAGGPRGVENLHLSPGSWTHVAVLWLLTLYLFRKRISLTLGSTALIYLAAITIPMAPMFNAFGRIGAWAEVPAGIGVMFFGAHPLKFFNVFLLAWIGVAMIRRLKREDPTDLIDVDASN